MRFPRWLPIRVYYVLACLLLFLLTACGGSTTSGNPTAKPSATPIHTQTVSATTTAILANTPTQTSLTPTITPVTTPSATPVITTLPGIGAIYASDVVYFTGLDGHDWQSWQNSGNWVLESDPQGDPSVITTHSDGNFGGAAPSLLGTQPFSVTGIYAVVTSIRLSQHTLSFSSNVCFDAGVILYNHDTGGYKLVICDGQIELRYLDEGGNTTILWQTAYMPDYKYHFYDLLYNGHSVCVGIDTKVRRGCVSVTHPVPETFDTALNTYHTELYAQYYAVVDKLPA